ncbi:hypothetical protein RQP46_000609 [Phenoliferia psychrophenolica]
MSSTIAASPDLPPLLAHTPTLLEPLSAALLALPPSLGLSYALFLPLATILLRTTTTLPIMLWQRKRTRKFAEVVMPLIRQAQQTASLEVRDESRRKGKSYEEYLSAFTARTKAEAKRLIREHRANPRLTLLLPPLLHIPIFITMTLVLRNAADRSLAAVSLIPDSPAALASYSDAALVHLHHFAATPFLWCESLVLPDPYMALPLAVGLAALTNVEVSAANRERVTADALASADARGADWQKNVTSGVVARSGPNISVAAKRRMAIDRARRESEKTKEKGGIMTFVMRAGALLFIPFAAMSPSAVCVYWLSSQLFTLAQNVVFHAMDRRREAALLRAPTA